MDINIYEFHKSGDEKIVISLSDFKGKRFINVRTWIDDLEDLGKQKWIRTHKGICISIELAEGLKEGINRLLAKLKTEDK